MCEILKQVQHDNNEGKIVEVDCVSPEASGDKNEGKIVEVECVRSFQDDKLFAKKIFIFSKIRDNPSPQSKHKKNLPNLRSYLI